MNIQLEKTDEYWIYDQKCKKLLDYDEIRFAGLINKMGRLVAGGFKPGISPLEDDAERKKNVHGACTASLNEKGF